MAYVINQPAPVYIEQAPPPVIQPAPVYIEQAPPPVIQPAPVYIEQAPPPVIQPAPVYIEQAPPPVIIQPAPPPTIIQPQPAVTMVQAAPIMVQSPMRSYPGTTKCNHCQHNVTTFTRPVNGLLTWIVFATLLVFCIWPFCLIPFCASSCRDIEHSCPNCRNIIHVHRRM